MSSPGPEPQPVAVATLATRDIFAVEVDGRSRRYDPMVVFNKLMRQLTYDDLLGKYGEVRRLVSAQLAAAGAGDTAAANAAFREYLPILEELAEVSREAFGLSPLDDEGAGVTVMEATDLLFEFLAWSEEKKGDTANSPSGSAPTAGPADSRPAPSPTPSMPPGV